MTTSLMSEKAERQSQRRRFRTPVPSILQLETTECGAASLGMVLARLGAYVPLEELRIACGVSRDGSTAKNIVKAARTYGLMPKAFRKEPDGLKSLEFPLIAHWRFYHFVVVEGWSPKGWYVSDPALGPRVVSHQEFDEAFTGIAIQAPPGPDFVQMGEHPGVVPRLLKAAGRVRAGFALAAIVFGKWRPFPAFGACLVFGLLDAVAIRLQGVRLPGIGEVPVQLIQALPYLLTVFLLAGFIGRAVAPRAAGVPYEKEP